MLMIKRLFLLIVFIALVACENSTVADTTVVQQQAVDQNIVTDTVEEEQSDIDSVTMSQEEQVENAVAEMGAQMDTNVFKAPWTGDLDRMVEERIVRVLTVYGTPRYFLDKGQEKGLTYEWFKMFENYLNEKLGRKHLRIHVVVLPVARDKLIPALLNGRGDIAGAGLTITPERAEVIDFSDPTTRELTEILVTGPSAPEIKTIEDLAGQKIFVRASSSYRASLDDLNNRFKEQGLEAIEIADAQEQLEDEDILEMVNAGLLEWAVVDDYKGRIWSDVFENLTVRKDLTFRTGGRIGLAMRKDSPQLMQMLNDFIKTHKQGSLKGNILINRYLKNTNWAKNALQSDEYERFESVVDIFSKFGTQYGIDYLMVAAQGYQESRLDQSAKSSAGAIGIMQLLPSTAADSNVGIPDISTEESNIHAGVKYLDFIRNRYFSDPGMDRFNQTLFAFAAYNAGPARVRGLRAKAEKQGYDPNIWFDNVEVIAAKEIGRETVQYVANILKYYVAYSLTLQQHAKNQKARADAGIE